MKTDPLQKTLHHLSEIRKTLEQPESIAALRLALGYKSNLAVAKAAEIARDGLVKDAVPELLAAFERLMEKPEVLDKGCVALTEIVAALYALDHRRLDVYRRVLRHKQPELAFGKTVDAAAKLRGYGAIGLVHSRSPDALFEILPLLVDPEPATRLGAVQALASAGSDSAVLLLQLKALVQDADPEVTGECLAGILSASFERAFPFVTTFLDSENEIIQETVILALGSSRRPQALETLKEKWTRTTDRRTQKTLLTAFASLRLDAAADYLLSLIPSAPPDIRPEMLRALALYRGDDRIRRTIEPVVGRWKDRALTEIYRAAFQK